MFKDKNAVLRKQGDVLRQQLRQMTPPIEMIGGVGKNDMKRNPRFC